MLFRRLLKNSREWKGPLPCLGQATQTGRYPLAKQQKEGEAAHPAFSDGFPKGLAGLQGLQSPSLLRLELTSVVLRHELTPVVLKHGLTPAYF